MNGKNKKNETYGRKEKQRENISSGWEIDPMEAIIRESSVSLLASGIAVPVVNLPDREDEESKMRE